MSIASAGSEDVVELQEDATQKGESRAGHKVAGVVKKDLR